jgi:hypothetical protein
VLWTPEGYYDASAGGEDLIGWHVNRGLDQAADYFPASRLRDRYYRPELVGAVLRTLDLDQAQRDAGPPQKPSGPAMLPPVIRILSPRTGEAVSGSPVEIRYSVRSPSGSRSPGWMCCSMAGGCPICRREGSDAGLLLAARSRERASPFRWQTTARSPWSRTGEHAGEAAAWAWFEGHRG